jgi:hypothetical protein
MSSQLSVKKRQAVGINTLRGGFDILLLSSEFMGKHSSKHAHTTESIQARYVPDLNFEPFNNAPFDATTMVLSLISDVHCHAWPSVFVFHDVIFVCRRRYTRINLVSKPRSCCRGFGWPLPRSRMQVTQKCWPLCSGSSSCKPNAGPPPPHPKITKSQITS